MRKTHVWIGFVLAVLLAMPGATLSAEQATDEMKLPQDTAFHLDARWVTVFDLGVGHWDQESDWDQGDRIDQTISNSSAAGVLGSSLYGMKIGWLINGHHDVGAHLLFGINDTRTKYDPEGENTLQTKVRLTHLTYRAALYYNYNFHPNTWVMPYLGPLVGVQGGMDRAIFEKSAGDNYTRQDFGLLPGFEIGVKLFPFQHVAFDLGALATYDIGRQRIDYDATENMDDSGPLRQLNVGAYAGLNVYFGKSAKPKPCPPCPECPKPVAAPAAPLPTTLTVTVKDRCTGQPVDSTITITDAAGKETTAANPTGTWKRDWAAGSIKITASAKGYDAKTATATVVGQKDNAVEIALYRHIALKDSVYFASGKDVILAKSYPVLDDVVAQIQQVCEYKKIVIEGHTDNVGKPEMNMDLSRRRAESVKAYLVSKGLDAAKLETQGFGDTKPVATNDTPEGRAQNRRVEFVIE